MKNCFSPLFIVAALTMIGISSQAADGPGDALSPSASSEDETHDFGSPTIAPHLLDIATPEGELIASPKEKRPFATLEKFLRMNTTERKLELKEKIEMFRDPSGKKLRSQVRYVIALASFVEKWREEFGLELVDKALGDLSDEILQLCFPCIGIDGIWDRRKYNPQDRKLLGKIWSEDPWSNPVSFLQEISSREGLDEEMWREFAVAKRMLCVGLKFSQDFINESLNYASDDLLRSVRDPIYHPLSETADSVEIFLVRLLVLSLEDQSQREFLLMAMSREGMM